MDTITQNADVDMVKSELLELENLSGEATDAQKEFFGKILNDQELKVYNETLENGENQRASTITNSILKKSKEIFNNKSVQKVANHLPYIGDFVMVAKMLRGKEGDKKLTAREYLFYGASVLSSAIGFYYLTQGEAISAGVSSAISEGVSSIDTSIGVMKDVSQKLMAMNPKLSGILSAVSNSFNKGKEALQGIGADIRKTLEGGINPDPLYSYAGN